MTLPLPVILLHGLGRTRFSMALLARRLAREGHPTVCLGYPSRRLGVSACADGLRRSVLAFRDAQGDTVAFVTHSMGGLVARVLAADPALGARAIVMLAPPNQGSEVADRVGRSPLGRLVLGPALDDLRTDRAGRLPVPPCPIGIVAGTRARLPVTGRVIPGRHDGLVSLERSRLPGAADWMTVAADHTFLMNHRSVAAATLAFLRDGRFPDAFRGV